VKGVARKALVTGGSGFIGSRLVRLLLSKGCSVRVLDIRRGLLGDMHDPQLEFIGLDADQAPGGMADRRTADEATEGADVVYHLALDWDGHSWRQAMPLADLWNINVRGAINLLEASISHGVRHFLYASSVAVYGKRDAPVDDEETICKPALWRGGPGPGYAIMKFALEQLCLLYHREHGLPVTVLRIDVVFDDEEYQDLSHDVIRAVLRGEPLRAARKEAGASVHVEDVARAFWIATLNPAAYGQVFNISNPEAYITDLEVLRIVIGATGSRSKIEPIETDLTGPVIGSIKKAREMLGWVPSKGRGDLERTIAEMARKDAREVRP